MIVVQVAPPSSLCSNPRADAARTMPGTPGTVITWWTSASMSIVGSHDPPPSDERKMPPTWTLA